MNKKETIEQIKKICESKGITAYEISKQTELSSVGIQKILNGETKNPNNKTLSTILDYLKRKKELLTFEVENHSFTASSEWENPPLLSKRKDVPYYNVDLNNAFEPELIPDFYIQYEPYNHADLWINNTGNSMSPIIENGDIIALQQKKDLNQMLYGEIYAIVFPEIRTIKYIRKSEKDDHILLVPHDLINYDEQDMPKNLIKSFFLVLGSIKKFF